MRGGLDKILNESGQNRLGSKNISTQIKVEFMSDSVPDVFPTLRSKVDFLSSLRIFQYGTHVGPFDPFCGDVSRQYMSVRRGLPLTNQTTPG